MVMVEGSGVMPGGGGGCRVMDSGAWIWFGF